MTPAPLRVDTLPKGRASVYLRRAEHLIAMVDFAEVQQNLDGVAQNAIQAAIALGDAYSIAKLGVRSRGQDHREVVAVITQLRTAEASECAKLLQRILDRKGEVEYGALDVSSAEASRLSVALRKLAKVVFSSVRAAD